jgi:hypothetical protein
VGRILRDALKLQRRISSVSIEEGMSLVWILLNLRTIINQELRRIRGQVVRRRDRGGNVTAIEK